MLTLRERKTDILRTEKWFVTLKSATTIQKNSTNSNEKWDNSMLTAIILLILKVGILLSNDSPFVIVDKKKHCVVTSYK